MGYTRAPHAMPKWNACVLLLVIFGTSVDAYSLRSWFGAVPVAYPTNPVAKDSKVVEKINEEATSYTSGLTISRPPPNICHGSGDKEPLDYTCQDQWDWGKCNESWLIEGDFCSETCKRCNGRIPVELDEEEGDNLLSTRSVDTGLPMNTMPDPGTKKCGGHIAYEWRIRTDRIKEASGVAASKLNKNVLWSHVDGYTNKVLAFLSDRMINRAGAFGEQGQPVAEIELPSWVNKDPKSGRVDWEDIAVAKCPDKSGRQCIWISDTGNNKFKRRYSNVIVVVEPVLEHMLPDPNRTINTEYFTPNQRDKLNREGLCQHGMKGDRCQYHSCHSDDVNLRKIIIDTKDVWSFSFKYPGTKEKDAEALAVAPDGSRFWLFEKNEHVDGANIYESDLLHYIDYSRHQFIPLNLYEIGLIKPPCIAAGTDCINWGKDHYFSITGADIHPLGHSMVLQTYRGPFVYEFKKPFDISSMQHIMPRDILGSSGWGAEAIAFSPNGDRLWQIPEENRHNGCQKVLTMDCAQPALEIDSIGELLNIRSKANTSIDTIIVKEGEEAPDLATLDSPAVEEPLPDTIKPEAPLTCQIIPNGWGTEKNASIPLCAGMDRVPYSNSTAHSCEEQASWGKCNEDWMIEGNYCMGACGRCTHTTCSCPTCGNKFKKPSLLCNSGAVTTTANASKLIIFDFDDTLKLHHPARQANDALWAVEETIKLGYGIAIASASCHTDYLRKFLSKELSSKIFTQELLYSNAFQTCQKKKTGALKCTLAHYGLLDKPQCAVFYDDSISNKKYADEANIKFFEVKKGVGVTKEKFKQGVDYLLRKCDPPAEMHHGNKTVVKDYNEGCGPHLDREPPGPHTCAEQASWNKCNESWMIEGDYCKFACGRCSTEVATKPFIQSSVNT